MVNQRFCPLCGKAARHGCAHLALAVPGRDFVERCIDASQAHRQWKALCAKVREHHRQTGSWSPDREDFTWLETAFCNRFLKDLPNFSSIDHEYRTGTKLDQGDFYVLLWSRKPEKLWWELLDQIDHQLRAFHMLPLPAAQDEPELFTSVRPRPGWLHA